MKAIFLFLLLATSAHAKSTGWIKISAIKKFPEKYGVNKLKGASLCKGKWKPELDPPSEWIANRLPNGINCLSADFDGNGFTDYAFLKTGWTEDLDAQGGTEVSVLMFGPKGELKFLPVSKVRSTFTFELYPVTAQKGKFGEPATRVPGLVEWGEGGSTTIWLFKENRFEATEYASENE